MKNIKVSSIESKENRITLLEDVGKNYPVRYSFFMTWKGKKTDVYDQFESLGVRIGQNYDVEVVEKPGKNAGGKDIIYRNITKFYDAPQKTPNYAPQSSTTQNNFRNTSLPTLTPKASPDAVFEALEALRERIRMLNANQDKMVAKILELEKKFRGLYGACVSGKKEVETAYEFHCEMDLKPADEEKPNLDVPF